jgi:hypothetical protein
MMARAWALLLPYTICLSYSSSQQQIALFNIYIYYDNQIHLNLNLGISAAAAVPNCTLFAL